MTVRGLMLAGAILASAPTPSAAACRLHSIWHYPWPQRCGVAHAQFRAEVSREKAAIQLPPERDIPLPVLTRSDCEGGEADELTRGRLMLRVALEAVR
jgi:hypothetical protein